MKLLIAHFKKMDWPLIFYSFTLSACGLIAIYSVSLGKGDFLNFKKQVSFFIFGAFFMFLLSFFDFRILKENSYIILLFYFLCISALLGLFFFAPRTHGVVGWYKFGPVSFDPIGPAIISLIFLLAKYFSKRHVEMYRLSHIMLSGAYALIPTLLIFRQPDMGSASIIVFIWMGILLISGIKLRHFLILFACGIIFLSVIWSFFLRDYQRQRVIAFISPETEILGAGWSQGQSEIAIGSGGLFGKGFGQGSQSQYGFLSEPYTDFIFSVIAEEFGLMGVIVIFLLFLFFFWRLMAVAFSSKSNFSRLFVTGFAIAVFCHLFIHIGMNVGLIPVVGIPLPFISYGGGRLIMFFAGIGIIQSIKTHS
jgi:rod shape determining protein RodA